MQYRKKPVVIEAYCYQAELGNNRLMNWLSQQGANVSGWVFHDGEISIPTLEGLMKVSDGDFIIRGVKGEYYPCKPDIFELTYEPVGANAPEAEGYSVDCDCFVCSHNRELAAGAYER